MPNLSQLLDLRLRCPHCHGELEGRSTPTRHCLTCNLDWTLRDGQWNFVGTDRVYTHDATDSMKSRAKTSPRLYAAVVYLFSPVYPQWFFESRKLRRSLTPEMVVVDIGAGNSRWSEASINVDLMPYPNVDVVAAADSIPLCNESVDCVTTIAMLEHVPAPQESIKEIERILRPGGVAYVYVPFMQGFHAAPHDYQRFTRPGLELALSGLKVERVENFGPTSGLVWVGAEWLSVVLCFGSHKLQRLLALAFMTVLSPLKFLDAGLRHFPGADNIATGFMMVARKPT